CGDLDGDGAVDLLVTTVAGAARVYRNVAPKRGHWLIVRAVDPALRRDAYGATIAITAGGRRWIGSITPGQSYLCSHAPHAHFGLGECERFESIAIRWPDGDVSEEVFPGGAPDRLIVLRRGEGRVTRGNARSSYAPKCEIRNAKSENS